MERAVKERPRALYPYLYNNVERLVPLLGDLSLRVWRYGLSGDELARESLAKIVLGSRRWVLRRVRELCSFAARQVERGGYSSRMKGLVSDLLRRMGLKGWVARLWRVRLHGKKVAVRVEGVARFMMTLRDALAEYAVREGLDASMSRAYTPVEYELLGYVVFYEGVIPAPSPIEHADIMRDKAEGTILDFGLLAPLLPPDTTLTAWHPRRGHAYATISTPLIADLTIARTPRSRTFSEQKEG